jgi:hypothetical protein
MNFHLFFYIQAEIPGEIFKTRFDLRSAKGR